LDVRSHAHGTFLPNLRKSLNLMFTTSRAAPVRRSPDNSTATVPQPRKRTTWPVRRKYFDL